jgi:hypothetical protein
VPSSKPTATLVDVLSWSPGCAVVSAHADMLLISLLNTTATLHVQKSTLLKRHFEHAAICGSWRLVALLDCLEVLVSIHSRYPRISHLALFNYCNVCPRQAVMALFKRTPGYGSSGAEAFIVSKLRRCKQRFLPWAERQLSFLLGL